VKPTPAGPSRATSICATSGFDNYVGLAEDRGYNSLLQLTSIKTTVASNPADVKMHMQYEFSATANAGRIDKA
jgi:hypothetical protein